jgi:hypothetical protein
LLWVIKLFASLVLCYVMLCYAAYNSEHICNRLLVSHTIPKQEGIHGEMRTSHGNDFWPDGKFCLERERNGSLKSRVCLVLLYNITSFATQGKVFPWDL